MRSCAAAWLLLLCVWSCSDPLYDKAGLKDRQADDDAAATADVARDGSQPRNVELDAGIDAGQGDAGALSGADASAPVWQPGAADAGAAAPALPALATRLLGNYVARSYGFWVDNSGAKMLVEELAIANFELAGDHVELSMHVCRQSTRTAGLSYDLISATGFPELRRTVSFMEDGFRTDDHPIATGFEREAPAACEGKPGQNIAKQPAQRWLDGTCRCAAASAEPPTLGDCRITDPDGDGAPALSYRLSALGWTSHLATVIRSHHVRGREAGASDLFAEVKLDEVGYQLSCDNPSCVDSDRFGRPCTSNYNGTQFVSLAARGTTTAISCETAVARETELFPTPLPAPPQTCVRDVLTDDPMRP